MAISTVKTPGVYIDEISVLPPSVAPVATAVPAFIGYISATPGTATLMQPVRITSLLDFTTIFGGPYSEKNIEAIVTTTANPAIVCDFESPGVSNYSLYYNMVMYFANGGGPCYVVPVGYHAASPAFVTQDFLDGLAAIAKEDEPTLLLFPEALNLSLAQYASVVQAALAQCNKLQDRFVIADLHGNSIATSDVLDFRTSLGSNYLKYGAVYAPFLNTTLEYTYADADVDVEIDGGTPVTLASITDQSLYNSLKQAISNQLKVVTCSSAAVAGIYASVDRDRGVWKAPANVSISSVIAPSVAITAAQQEDLNVDTVGGKSINAIRAFTGKGTLVWGARTLAGNDNEWRYVNVRRLFNFAEESIKKASEFVVFESNDANTWVRVKSLINNFLTNLWRDGALVGAKPEHAFFVKVGLNETMTAQDILEGKMIVQVGLAASRPAEFIILQFVHKLQES